MMEGVLMGKTAEEILLQVISKLDVMREADDLSRANINILSILDKETDEVVMRKVLWAILDYKSGCHALTSSASDGDILLHMIYYP